MMTNDSSFFPGHVHVLGVCGTAMAAIAKLAKDLGWQVTGSDAGVYPPMSDYLQAEHIQAFDGYDAKHLHPQPGLVLIGNAMSRGNAEVEASLNMGLTYMSGPEFLARYVLPARHSMVVAGTHGKTSTSTLLAYVLDQAGLAPGFMIGGIPEDFGSGARLGVGLPFVLEGDEYDTAFFDKRSKFLHYQARTLILNNLEYDHADIFPDLEAIKTQFQYLLRTVPSEGLVVVNADDAHVMDVLGRGCWSSVLRFAIRGSTQEADWHWQALTNDGAHFALYYQGECWLETHWNMIGKHQVANACAVAAVAHDQGIAADVVAKALASFAGIRRRMTLVGKACGVSVYDDFAHHPTAIAGVVSSMRARLGQDERLWVLVEPRSNTMRTKIHQQRLPQCFAGADWVRFVPPSTRNLQADEVLDVNRVCQTIGAHAACLPDVEYLVQDVASHAKAGDHVLVLSNGGFDGIHQRLLDALCGNG